MELKELNDIENEVIEKAREMGYFEYPREVAPLDIATELDISVAEFEEVVRSAYKKLVHNHFVNSLD